MGHGHCSVLIFVLIDVTDPPLTCDPESSLWSGMCVTLSRVCGLCNYKSQQLPVMVDQFPCPCNDKLCVPLGQGVPNCVFPRAGHSNFTLYRTTCCHTEVILIGWQLVPASGKASSSVHCSCMAVACQASSPDHMHGF